MKPPLCCDVIQSCKSVTLRQALIRWPSYKTFTDKPWLLRLARDLSAPEVLSRVSPCPQSPRLTLGWRSESQLPVGERRNRI